MIILNLMLKLMTLSPFFPLLLTTLSVVFTAHSLPYKHVERNSNITEGNEKGASLYTVVKEVFSEETAASH